MTKIVIIFVLVYQKNVALKEKDKILWEMLTLIIILANKGDLLQILWIMFFNGV